MSHINRNIIIAGLLALFSLTACRKEDAGTRPLINIFEPAAFSTFSLQDTIRISGDVSHKKEIRSLKIVFRDNMNNAVTVPRYLFPNSTRYSFDIDYLLDAPWLESGLYSLAVTASDGVLDATEYLSVNIEGAEQYFQRVLVLCRPSILKTYAYTIDSAWQVHNVLNTDYGFTGSALTSSQRKLILIKPQPSSVFAYDLDDMEEDHWLTAAPPYPVFNDVFSDGDLTYVATENGDVKGLNQAGQLQYVTHQSLDTIPLLLHTHNNLLMSFARQRGGTDHFVRQYYKASGALRDFFKVSFNVVKMFSADSEFCLLMAEQEGLCSIYQYHPEDNYLGGHINMPLGNITDAVKTSANDYLIAHSEGLYHYVYGNGYLSLWQSGIDTDVMAYDATRSLLYCAKGRDVKVFRIDNGALVREITMPYPVYDMHIQYNR